MHTHIAFLLSSDKNLNKNNYFPDNYSNEIDEALHHLTEIYNIAYECAPTQLLQNTSLFIVKANMLKARCYNQHVSETVTKCAYYLGI